MVFQKATKKKCKLRAALFGPSGSGKTFTALRVAKGLGGSIAVIDTEHGSASKYSDRFGFDVCELDSDQTIDSYVDAIGQAAEQHYDVLIIDSMTHGWQELLVEIDRLAQTKYKGNTWSAWKDGTPKQKKLIRAILGFPGHILATMRSKTEWESTKDERGKVKPVRVGLAPDEGKGIEYEFDLLVELSTEHVGTVIKDRTGKFQDKMIEKPGEDFGKAMSDWLNEGEDVPELAKEPHPAVLKPLDGRKLAFLGEIERACGNKAAAVKIARKIIREALTNKETIDNDDEMGAVTEAAQEFDLATGDRLPERSI